MSTEQAIADATNPSAQGSLIDICHVNPYYSLPGDTTHVLPSPTNGYPWQRSDVGPAECLISNGVGRQSAVNDATNPKAYGDLLNMCRTDSTYNGPGYESLTTHQGAVAHCLLVNGVGGTLAAADALNPAAHGTLLNLCRAHHAFVHTVDHCNHVDKCTAYLKAPVSTPAPSR